MKKFVKILVLCLISTSLEAEVCQKEYEKWQELLNNVQSWSEASVTAGAVGAGAGSFFGPVGGLAGVATGGFVGLGAWYQDSQAEKAEKIYLKCVANHTRKMEEKRAKKAREAAKARLIRLKKERIKIELEKQKQAEERKKKEETTYTKQREESDEIEF